MGDWSDGLKLPLFSAYSIKILLYFDNVFLFDNIIEQIGSSYNEAQLNIFASAEGFIAMGGGSSILCSYFNKPVIIYVNTSKDIRPGYFYGDSYFNKLSNASIYPVVDTKAQIKGRGWRDYSEVYHHITKPEPNKCHICGFKVFKRWADDNEMSLKIRLMSYYRDTSPLIGYYYAKGNLHSINGLQDINIVAKEIGSVLIT